QATGACRQREGRDGTGLDGRHGLGAGRLGGLAGLRQGRQADGRARPCRGRAGVELGGRIFFFSSRRQHTRWPRDWSSDVCSSDLASLERGSEHPLGAAIVSAAQENGFPLVDASGFRYLPGKGVVGNVDGKTVAAGSEKLFEELRIPSGELSQKAEDLRRSGQTGIFVAIDGSPSGLIGIADPIKPSTAQAIHELKSQGIRIVM